MILIYIFDFLFILTCDRNWNEAIKDILNSKSKVNDDHVIAMSEFFEHCPTVSRSAPFLKTLDI